MRFLAFALALLVGFGAASTSLAAPAILVYDHNTINNRAQDALTSLGLGYTLSNSGNFNTQLTSGAWDLVVVDVPSTIPSGGFGALNAYVAGGGRAIISYWNLQGDPALAAAFEVAQASSFSTPQNVSLWDPGHPIFNSPNSVGNLTSWTDFWADDGDRLNTVGSAIALAGFTGAPSANNAAIVLGNSGRTIYNGFLFDELNDPTGTNLFANEIQFLLAPVPEPASLALWSILGLTGGIGAWRRRKAKVA